MEFSGKRIRLNSSDFQDIMINDKRIQNQNLENTEDQEINKKNFGRTNERFDRDILKRR